MHSKQTVPQGMRESTPVERILDLHASASSVKQEFPGFSRGECHVLRDGEWRKVYHVRDRCKVCGRVGSKSGVAFRVTEGTPVYDVGGFEGLFAKELGEELRAR